MKPQNIEPFFAALKAANPQPETELEYTNVFELLAAVLLSAQATDVGVNKATRRLFAVANTPAKMLALGLDAVTEHIRTIGLFRTKAKNLLATCRILIEQHAGRVPCSRSTQAREFCLRRGMSRKRGSSISSGWPMTVQKSAQ